MNEQGSDAPRPSPVDRRARALKALAQTEADPNATLARLMRLAVAHSGARWSAVSLTDGVRVITVASDGRSLEEPASAETFASRVLAEPSDAVVVPDASKDPGLAEHPWLRGESEGGSLLGVAISPDEGMSVGSLVVFGATSKPAVDAPALAALQDLAGLVGDALRALELSVELADLRSDLARLQASDPLTGLLNRRTFQERLDSSLALSRRTGHGLALALLDVDDFKSVNERHGSGVGDALLMRVADALEGAARDHDLVARVGADEFAILWQATAPEGALVAAQRTLQAVNRSFELVDAHEPGAVEIETSVSLGLACFPEDAEDWVGLLRAADVAMYGAKRERGGVRRYRPVGG